MKRLLRDFILGLVSASLISCSVAKAPARLEDKLNIEYEEVSQNAKEYNAEQLFVSSNPRIHQNFRSNGYAYVIVHPGFWEKDMPGYPGYPQYIDKIIELIKNLENSGELTIFAMEEEPTFWKKEFEPFDSAFVMVTENNDPELKKYVKTNDGIERQRPDLIYSFLKDNGIKKIRFSGEFAWSDHNKHYNYHEDDDNLACLGITAENFYNKGFDIKGIESCIYPIEASKRYNEILDKLYNDTVNLQQILNQ